MVGAGGVQAGALELLLEVVTAGALELLLEVVVGAGVLELLLEVVTAGVLELLLEVVTAGVLELLLEVVDAGALEVVLGALHVLSLTAATVEEYLPTTHEAHASDPLTDLYLPAPHATQIPPPGPVYPALHWHSVLFLLPGADDEFDGHVLHASDPIDALYIPELQTAQCMLCLSTDEVAFSAYE